MKRPTRRQRIADLKGLLAYEEHPGVHTYHQCECGRGNTRIGRCPKCLREEIETLVARDIRDNGPAGN
jgi:hypothetical protein